MNASGLTLGISTAGPVEVALVGGELDLATASDRGALESLAVLLERLLRQGGVEVDALDLIGVCTGPGSFTGLRIGVAFAKTLAQTRNIPIVGISSYDVAEFAITFTPIVSVARGKRDYYYARLTPQNAAEASFAQGSRVEIERAAKRLQVGGAAVPIVGPDFSSARPGDAARAVAELACRSRESANLHWTNVAIDYGQRPNAVTNWEKRRSAAQEGRPSQTREHSS